MLNGEMMLKDDILSKIWLSAWDPWPGCGVMELKPAAKKPLLPKNVKDRLPCLGRQETFTTWNYNLNRFGFVSFDGLSMHMHMDAVD